MVVPGGGWTVNAWTHKGIDIARWLAPLGFTAFLLKYRAQASNPDRAEFEAQMATIDASLASPIPKAAKPRAEVRRAAGNARNDRFSAGAFLAVDVALDPRSEQLAWIAPIYGGETQGARARGRAAALHRRCAGRLLVNIVEGLHADWAAADRPLELHVFPAARTASGWSSRAFRPTAGRTCSSRGSTTSARRRLAATHDVFADGLANRDRAARLDPGGAERRGMVHQLLNARGSGTFTVADALGRIDAMTKTIATAGIGVLVLRKRPDGEALGYAGIVVGRSTLDEPELAYELLRAHGHGYATEAARALRDAAFETGRRRIWATIRSSNAPSLRVAEKLGFRRDHCTTEDVGEVVWMVCDR